MATEKNFGEQLSYVSGVADKPLLYQTIAQALDAAAQKWGDKTAIVSTAQNKRLTYQELQQAADDMAAYFLSLGLAPGERIGIWSPNNMEWTITQYATAALGLILVNINPAYRLHELEYALNLVGCKALVLADKLKTSDYVAMMEKLTPNLLGQKGESKCPTLQHLLVIGEADGAPRFADVAGQASPAQLSQVQDIKARLQPEEAINIQFTSGTTGSPKGATLTHHNILNNGYFVGAAMCLEADDRICVPVPLYHCFGMVMGNLAALTHGCSVVYPAATFEPEATLQAVQDEKCTALYGVPTMFVAMLEIAKNYDCSHLRTGTMAGAPCPVESMKRVISEMNMSEVTISYGMTETSPVSFQSSNNDTLERRVSTIGRVHPHVEVKIIDLDGRVVKAGEQGELCTRGYSVMRGYWGDSEKTAQSIDSDGWMHTGDLAVVDEAGYGKITGRLKDMIIRGGENIYPLEIEEFFRGHEAIIDVAVFGVPDEKYGEIVAAWVLQKPDGGLNQESLQAYCKDQIAHYKVPKIIQFVDEFPMTVTGKIRKIDMREAVSQELGVQELKTA